MEGKEQIINRSKRKGGENRKRIVGYYRPIFGGFEKGKNNLNDIITTTLLRKRAVTRLFFTARLRLRQLVGVFDDANAIDPITT